MTRPDMFFRGLFRWQPALAWALQSHRARSLGLRETILVLSFDCDTDQDAQVVGRLAERLDSLGISATYAVPGEQLIASRAEYRALHQRGHEFIAHGFTPHTALRNGRYVSTHFYNDLDQLGVMDDVHASTSAFTEALGIRPMGFRAPHFGTLDGKRRRWLYSALEKEGYRFSSSTLPAAGIRRGPAYPVGNLIEIPLSGCFRAPLAILDSYNFRFAPGHPLDPNAYTRAFVETLAWSSRQRSPIVLNTYADPSQVHDWPPFWTAIETVAEMGISTITYSHLLELVGPLLGGGSGRGTT